MGNVAAKYDARIAAGRQAVEPLIRAGVGYKGAIAVLAFYYCRKQIALHYGSMTDAAAAAGMTWHCMRDRIDARAASGPASLPGGTIEAWAAQLAADGLNYREATFIFKRTLLLTAIAIYGGNRVEAARRLKVHRNTTIPSRIPVAPAYDHNDSRRGRTPVPQETA
jgi:hypothetical protein